MAQEKDPRRSEPPPQTREVQKKQYEKPGLRTLGTVRELTQSNPTNGQ